MMPRGRSCGVLVVRTGEAGRSSERVMQRQDPADVCTASCRASATDAVKTRRGSGSSSFDDDPPGENTSQDDEKAAPGSAAAALVP